MDSLTLLLMASLVSTSIAYAQSSTPALAEHHPTNVAQSPSDAPYTAGEVRKVDKEAGKITLKHAELKNLDMPPMTMVFQVKDAALLDKVKAGDKVRFVAEKVGGQFTVTALEPDR